MLKAGAKQEIKVTFMPDEAKVTVSTAVFNFSEGNNTLQRVLKMSGIGKFPFVSLNHERLDFEQLTVGKDLSKSVTLRNYSLVRAEYTLESVNDDGKDDSIKLSNMHGTIDPGSSATIVVTFCPSIVGQFTSRQYAIKVKGGNELKLVTVG